MSINKTAEGEVQVPSRNGDGPLQAVEEKERGWGDRSSRHGMTDEPTFPRHVSAQ